MTTWVQQLQAKASIVHDQIIAAKEMQALSGVDTSGVAAGYWRLLEKLYSEDLQLARLMDTSDLLLHAEGPGAADALPSLQAINWLCHTAEKQLKSLAKATLDLSENAAGKLTNMIDLRLTGFAPGSLYAGFKLQPPESTLLQAGETEPVFMLIRDTISQLPEIPGFIEDNAISSHIREAIPDAAIRDAMLNAVMELAPSGAKGIDSVEISSPLSNRPTAAISQRNRMVIRSALNAPSLAAPHAGDFSGEIREIDLDARRFHLRNIKGVGAIRCVYPKHFRDDHLKQLLGSETRVIGQYETGKNGQPRLMLVEGIERIRSMVQMELMQ
jgi:hypothetical protein